MADPTENNIVVSIVTYAPDMQLLARTLESLVAALQASKDLNQYDHAAVFLVDNGPGNGWQGELRAMAERLAETWEHLSFSVISGQGNVGFGAGHNLTINRTSSRFHLVLNPDAILDSQALVEGCKFMADHQDVICISPYSAEDPDGGQQFLCKRYPALLDLGLRGFAPGFIKKLFRKRLARYEMRGECGGEPVLDVQIVSGCFMFFRSEILHKLGGFAPEYFLYFEDFDLSLRAGRLGRLAYVPQVKITHFGGNTARKGRGHIKMFLRSALIFYRHNGLRIW